MANYTPVTYFDRITLDDLLVCEECGALVHPNRANKHDMEHEHVEHQVERINHIEGI